MRAVPRHALLALTLTTGCAPEGSDHRPAATGEGTASFDEGQGDTDTDTDPGPSDIDASSAEGAPDLPESDLGTGEDAGPDLGDGGDGGAPSAPPLYPGDRVHSPINAAVLEALEQVRAQAPQAPSNLFMKVGASSTVNAKTLHCFATAPVDLGEYEGALGPTLDFFLGGRAGDTTPFDRPTLAAEVGKTAAWVLDGAPSPLEAELAAIDPQGPSLALVHYGANDMQQGITYASAMPGYYAAMSDLLDQLLDLGVVPVVFGLSRRLDQPSADLWVQSYNALARGLAQARQIPFVDLRLALEVLPGYGLSGDGLHLEGDPAGACLLTPSALEHGYNIRNRIALEVLARLERALLDGVAADPSPPLALDGDGSFEDPLRIDALPFADTRDSAAGPAMVLDVYTGCEATADESGPEHLYRLELDAPARIRALVLDRSGVDIDLHLLDESASEAGCLARGDMLIEAELDAGIYHFSLDTYVNGEGVEQGGEYTFVVLECEGDDPDCAL